MRQRLNMKPKEKPMKSLNKLASITVLSAMVLLATGCDRKDKDSDTTTGDATTTNPTAGERMDNTAAEAKQETAHAGNHAEHTIEQAGQSIGDAAITTTIKAKLVADDELKAIDINVDTAQGIVTLTGAAPSPTAVERATTIARGVNGVSDVKNQLTIKTN